MVLRFKSGKTLVVTVKSLALLYVKAYGAIILDRNEQLLLDFSA